VLLAITSSFLKKPIPFSTAIFGEVGLSGELRKVSHSEKRKKESEKLGFDKIVSAKQYKEISAALNTLQNH